MFGPDRIDGPPGAPALRPESATIRDGEAMLIVPTTDGDDLEFYFPALDGAVNPGWAGPIARVLAHLAAMDDEIRRAGAAEGARSPHPASHHEGDLAFVTLIAPDEVALRYYVRRCNSEWDERFAWRDGRWSSTTSR